MVHVTKSNFLTHLRDFLTYLPTASFVAIDEEMTGIRIGNRKPNKAELPSVRYKESLKGVPEKFGILQVGVALFHKNPDYVPAPCDGNCANGSRGEVHRGGPGLGMQDPREDDGQPQDVVDTDVNEHSFMHREGTLNQDELEDWTEREEDEEVAAAGASRGVQRDVPEYTCRIYNFYLFPNAESQHQEVTMAPDAVKFLLDNQMDFNKVFSEGISFTTCPHAERLKQKFFANKKKRFAAESENENGNNSTAKKSWKERVKLTRAEDIAFVARTMASLREWIDADNGGEEEGNTTGNDNGGAQRRAGDGDGASTDPDTGIGRRQTEGTSLILPPCNAFLRRCLYETIEAEYPGLVLEKADSGPNAGAARNQIRVIRLSSDEKKQRAERILQEEWSRLLYTIGFTTVFQAISDACNGKTFSEENTDAFFSGQCSGVSVPVHNGGRKIPLVIHNGLMDLMFLLTHCHDSTLPDSFEDTKKLIRVYFPLVYDTKILSTECSDADVKGGSTALGDLYRSLFSPESNDPVLKVSTIMNQNDRESNGQAHEAAWDAYMTGCVFYGLCKKILEPSGTRNEEMSIEKILQKESLGNVRRDLLGLNKIYFHFSLYTIDLESSSGIPGLLDPLSHGLSVNTTFYVTGIDTNVSTRDILQALTHESQYESELLQHLKYEIIWMDDTSFFVGTKLDDIVSGVDSGTINLIAVHVHDKLHTGLKGVQVLDLVDFFKQESIPKESVIGSFASAVAKPFQMLGNIVFGARKRSHEVSEGQQGNKRSRVE
eukprot:CCRYP_005535-RB/>CCRYP_005535-RB protein AED:0.12 eAED:0.12 QI:118/1/1/1/0.5/0.33/3/4044/772